MEKNKNESLTGNIVKVLSANFWVAVVGFVGSFIFPKILSIEGYALYHTFTLYVSYIGILHLGFPSGMAIKYAGKNYETLDKNQYKSEVTLLLFTLCTFTAIAAVISLAVKEVMVGYITLAILPVCMIASYKSLYQAWSRFKEYTRVSTICATFVPVLALIYYLLAKNLPGDVYILIYLIVYWVVAIILISMDVKIIRKAQRNKWFTVENFNTEKVGISLMLGNYINTLFVSADKQFVKIFFGTTEFAFYSFGMSMQALMTVFITSVAQPLFPAMAKGKFKDEDYNKIMKLLLVFGSFSGCAYFATSIIVRYFIKKYIGSLEIVGIYFVVFPAMAVINCLYINLYKIKGLMKQYLITLVGILAIAVILNMSFIHFIGSYAGVAIATTLTYYIWFMLGFRQFLFLKLQFRDIVYLIIYTVGFFFITRNFTEFLGMAVYLVFILTLAMLCYRELLLGYMKKILKFN